MQNVEQRKRRFYFRCVIFKNSFQTKFVQNFAKSSNRVMFDLAKCGANWLTDISRLEECTIVIVFKELASPSSIAYKEK